MTTVRAYTKDDQEMVEGWYRSHRGLGELPVKLLPPLGVIVEDENGPAGALWCYECAGCPVAIPEFPIARPGLSMNQAKAVFVRAMEAVMALAGKGWEPQGVYSVFRAWTTPPIFRQLKKMGFITTGSDVIPCILVKTPNDGN